MHILQRGALGMVRQNRRRRRMRALFLRSGRPMRPEPVSECCIGPSSGCASITAPIVHAQAKTDVRPTKAFGFTKGDTFSQTRWRF